MIAAGTKVRGGEVVVSPAEREEWNRLVSMFADRTVYHSLAWIETLEAAHGLRPLLLRAMVNDECVAVWPCLELSKGPIRVVGSPLPGWSTAYMGPLFADSADVEATTAGFMAHPALRRASYIECRVVDSTRNIDLSTAGFNRHLRFETYLLDLCREETDIWAGLESSCRNKIRKAENAGIAVRIESTSDWVDDFWAMSLEVFSKSNRMPGYDRQFLMRMWARLRSDNAIEVFSALEGDRRAAVIVMLFDDRCAYYWGGASHAEFLRKAPNNIALWRSIQHAAERGLTRFDFVSSRGGPGRFKKTFGPEPREVATHWSRSRTPIEGMLKRCYERFARWRLRA